MNVNNKVLGGAISGLTLLGFLWQAAGAWFTLVERVRVLEQHEQYLHGKVQP